jgi:hypothetical protein
MESRGPGMRLRLRHSNFPLAPRQSVENGFGSLEMRCDFVLVAPGHVRQRLILLDRRLINATDTQYIWLGSYRLDCHDVHEDIRIALFEPNYHCYMVSLLRINPSD